MVCSSLLDLCLCNQVVEGYRQAFAASVGSIEKVGRALSDVGHYSECTGDATLNQAGVSAPLVLNDNLTLAK